MKTPRILIFGSHGQVGWELRHRLACLGSVTAADYPEVDFSKPDSIRDAVRGEQPSVIVNAAAYTAVDKAEREPELAMVINGVAPGILAEEAKRHGSIFVHYSTDYVFDGEKSRAFEEEDGPNPLNVYGRTKLAGDLAVQDVGGDYLIFRTSWVYGARGNNFLLTMLRLAQDGRPELRIVDDQIGAPTSSECIAEATADVLAQLLAPTGRGLARECSGVYNLTCGGETTWFGFAMELLSAAASMNGIVVPTLVPVRSSEFGSVARRPANSRLSAVKLQRTFGVSVPHWKQALSLVMETLAMHGTGVMSSPSRNH